MHIFESQFPGNASSMDRLLASMRAEGIIGFTGAGTSMPDLPSWGRLVGDMIDEAERDGRIDQGTATALRAEESDFLYVFDEIYNAMGAAQAKSKVASIFASLKDATASHNLLTSTAFSRFMTLNYDSGLESSFARQSGRYIAGITADNSTELDKWIRGQYEKNAAPVLHWHGMASDAQSIILSGSDYVSHYDKKPNAIESFRRIFGASQVLLIGFGFRDAFIERELNSLMQGVQTGDIHHAIIGVEEGKPFNLQLERRRYASKYKMETIFYPISRRDGSPDHSALAEVLRYLSEQCPTDPLDPTASKVSASAELKTERSVSYRNSLFAIGDKQIYCEPNIRILTGDVGSTEEPAVRIEEILAEPSHCCIMANHEYGLTNLGRRLASELSVAGTMTLFREADSIPKYRKAILSDKDFARFSQEEVFTLILDDFSAVDHQRTVKELTSYYAKARVVVLQKDRFGTTSQETLSELKFKFFALRGLSRSNIRSVVNTIAPDYNSDDTSVIVDKVYLDLMQLCIPLTPSNVIMYASVICKDGTFSPVSRLHIVDKFVAEALQRASDAYADTFNSIDKIDLISFFCFELFEKDAASFQLSEWEAFCTTFKAASLVEFGAAMIIADLVNGRILIRDGSFYIFRYRMFYSYFVGRHISSHRQLLEECLSKSRHLELDGLVEVLCGTLTDASIVLDDLSSRLSQGITEFYKEYPIAGLDCHAGIRWEADTDDSALWESVTERFDKGPAGTQELDELKTSIHAERRTDDQKVSIIKFIASEQSVSSRAIALVTALGSVKHASAPSKVRAAAVVIDGMILTYEVANIFVPLIAERKYVAWNGFVYINLIEDKVSGASENDAVIERERKQGLVAYALPGSISRNAADRFGSKKLGPVFLSLMKDTSKYSEFKKLTLFALLLRSKPTGWLECAKKEVGLIDRHRLYLRHMLICSLRQFRVEINTEKERQSLKELTASIKLRRDVNLKSASPSQIKGAVSTLDSAKFFAEPEDSAKNMSSE